LPTRKRQSTPSYQKADARYRKRDQHDRNGSRAPPREDARSGFHGRHYRAHEDKSKPGRFGDKVRRRVEPLSGIASAVQPARSVLHVAKLPVNVPVSSAHDAALTLARYRILAGSR
jgi:hypothetical protein